ncbi:cytochrome d ubiquinol oxidase subunit II [Catenovulum sp. SM1970]|uniref:cytochrome d ubiquinol oxidase subunit II n=1 Tax=Marinifaba aquimaris TaxID=2741323 RepID=UPI001572EB0E|nr:cytochrome d ubiquinol oxidase subunit II [Marinifaba aquimaris]NTS76311.1 cytochrome d ubiquinol oxidase subunit II [Marinifaba aquimaris]
MFDQATLALIYAGLMALAVLLYAMLDGYDLGVGMMLPLYNQADSDTMIASIGPFWDANETWLVLAIGVLLIAFPFAHSLILKALYLPAAIMLIGLILRGVAFDFRAKAAFSHKPTWDKVFKAGSFIAAASQGFMLGLYVMGFEYNLNTISFALLSALGVCAAYCFIGSAWLVMKTEGELQQRALRYCKRTLVICFAGIVVVSITNLLIDPNITERWFSMPYALVLLPIPLICLALFIYAWQQLKVIDQSKNQARPFVAACAIFTFTFVGLAVSFYPYVVPNQMTIYQSVAAAESLNFLLYGALFVIPTILAYTLYSYRVFWGKVEDLRYY